MASRDLRVTLIGDDRTGSAFGSAGNNADGLATKFANLGKGIALALGGAAVAGVAGLGVALVQGVKDAASYQKITDQVAQTIKSTGAAAGVSIGGLKQYAGQLESMSGVDEELILSGQNVLLTFTKIRNGVGEGNDIFDQASQAALNLSTTMGGDLVGANTLVGKALNDPIAGMTALRRAGVQLTDAQKDQVTAMVESGNVMGAQKIILGELETQFGGAAAAAGQGLTGSLARAKDAFQDMFRGIATALLPKLAELAEFFANRLMPGIKGIYDLVIGGDFTGALREAFGWEEDSGIVKFLFGLRENFIALWPRIKAAGAALGEVASAVGGYLLPKLQDLWSVFNSKVLPVLKDIGGFITGTMVPALQKLGGFIADHKTLFESLAVGVGAAFAAFKIYQAGLAIWAAVTKGYAAVQAALNVVMAANPIGIIVLAIAALVAGLIYAYKHSETFRDIVNGAFDAVKQGVGNAIGFMITGFRMLLTVWLTVADGIISGAATALGWIPGLGDKLKAANTAFDNMKDGILDTLDEAAQKAYGFGEKSGSNAAKGLDSTKQGAFNAGKQVGDDMGRGVGAGSGTAYDAGYSVGANAGQGLINGIKSKELGVARQAQILAITAGKAMQTGLQVQSPSRLTMWMGQMLGQGLIDGMASMRPAVTAEMLRMADTQALGSLTARGPAGVGGTPAMSGAVAARSNAPQVHIEQYNEARQSPQQIAQDLTFLARTGG